MSTTPETSPVVGIRGYRVRNPAKTEQRKQEILHGAARAFARKGYQATNLDDIAAEAGLAKGHIYHYFLNKEQLFTEIRVSSTEAEVAVLEEIVAEGHGPEQTLRMAITEFIARQFGPIESQAVLLSDPPDISPENRARIRAAQRKYEKLFRSVVEEGVRTGILVQGDSKLMAFILMRSAQDVSIFYRPGREWTPQFVTEQVTEQLMRSVLSHRCG